MSQANLPPVTIYSDGGCNPNPGPGGWGVILLHPGHPPQELSGSHPNTTNNQMELTAAIEALKTLSAPHTIQFYTDSKYLRQGITEWLPQWQRNNWKTSQNKAVKNQALWQALALLIHKHRIEWHWTKGHAGNRWNEQADKLASAAIPKNPLPLNDNTVIHLFVAGSYSGKRKTGGWAAILRYQEAEKSISGKVEQTSANQMHLQAAIKGLQAIKKPLPIHLYTPSDYLKNGATMWVKQWQARNWKTKEGKAVSNKAYWQKLLQVSQNHNISWHVVSKDALPPEMKQAKILSAEAMKTGD